MDLKIDTDDYLKKLQQQQDAGVPTVQVNPQGGNGQDGTQGANGQSFEEQYGSNNIFGAEQNAASGSAAPTYQNVGAAAGSTNAPVNTNDSGPQTFSLADAVQMDNLPVAATSVPTQAPELSSGITAGGNSEGNNPQGGATDNGAGENGPKFGAGDVMNLTGGLGTTEVASNSTSDGGYVSVFGNNDTNGTGGAGMIDGGEGAADGVGGTNDGGTTNGVDGNNGNANGVVGTGNGGEADGVNGENGNVNGSGNDENPEDSANGDVNKNDPSNPQASANPENDPNSNVNNGNNGEDSGQLDPNKKTVKEEDEQ